MGEPPTGLFGCVYDRFQEITFTLVGLFWIVLFFAVFKLIKRKAEPKTIIITFACCYAVGIIAFNLIVGFLSYG